MAAQRLGGKLYLNPTDKTAVNANFGGTFLGAISGLYFLINRKLIAIQAFETGYPAEYFVRNGVSLFGVNFREPNPAVMSILFGAGAGSGGFPKVSLPGNQPTGTIASHNKILFVPDYNTEQQAFIFYRAYAQLDPTERIRASALRETTYPVIFEAIPDSSNRTLESGLLQDLVF